ncbi:MAG: phenylalanine--tRNA ligase beta subunit [Micavibrio sp.]|nr:MAG: phenylalanine--tRNA ligase beta subunit [Micavibrio sp.]
MKFTLSWLKRHLDTDSSLEDICDKLTAIGLEVEGLEDRAKMFEPFTVAHVEKAEKHPDADKLKICTVKTKNGTLQVVCGAPNARTGMKGIFAPEGSVIPGSGDVLKKGVIRGVESCGMLVSESEMGLSDDHDGIIEVDDKFDIGTPFADVYGLGDPLIDIALTPNRADCAGVRGIARDLAAAGLGKLKDQDESTVKGKGKCPVDVKIEDKDGCPLFIGRYIKDVKNGPSPDWLQQMLTSIGLRPISALVDITNLMNIDQCRPLHVFDANKLEGNITVRKTEKGEKIDALNDKSYETIEGAIGISDDSGLLALGGVVGGVPTGCTEDTTNVFVEAAYFNPMRIARTGRDMQIESDARYRFERGVDPEFTATGMEIATRLILEICGGEASEVVSAGDVPDWKRQIEYDPAYVEKLAGFDVPANEQNKILTALGFEVSGKGPFKVTPPPWRGDVHGKPDIVEEIIRITGYENIPPMSVRSEAAVTAGAETLLLTHTRKARSAMSARGMDECVTWSFMGKDLAGEFGSNDNALTLSNPISSELDQMRPSILPNLIEAAGRNADRGFGNTALCEVGPVFQSPKPDGQQFVATGLRAGGNALRHWADENSSRGVDAFDAKADAIAVLDACGAPGANAQVAREAPDYYHPGRSGTLKLGKNILAQFGEIHPAILEDMGVKGPVVGFEVFLQSIPESKRKGTAKKLLKLAPLQPLSRDFSFLVDDSVSANDIVRAAKTADKNLIADAYVFDIYTGKGVDDGKKSVALNVTIQPKDKTLTDEELEALSKEITDNVSMKTGGTLRS